MPLHKKCNPEIDRIFFCFWSSHVPSFSTIWTSVLFLNVKESNDTYQLMGFTCQVTRSYQQFHHGTSGGRQDLRTCWILHLPSYDVSIRFKKVFSSRIELPGLRKRDSFGSLCSLITDGHRRGKNRYPCDLSQHQIYCQKRTCSWHIIMIDTINIGFKGLIQWLLRTKAILQ